jgi:hypothetical protein
MQKSLSELTKRLYKEITNSLPAQWEAVVIK